MRPYLLCALISKSLTLTFALLACCLPSLAAQGTRPAPPPELLKGANSLVQEEQYHLNITSDSTAELFHRVVVAIINREGFTCYPPIWLSLGTTIKDAHIWLYDEEGREVFYADAREKYSNLQPIPDGFHPFHDQLMCFLKAHEEYPFTLAYEYTLQLGAAGMALGASWVPQLRPGVAVANSSFRVSVPKEIGIQYHVAESVPAAKERTTSTHYIYEWSVQDLPPLMMTNGTSLLKVTPTRFTFHGMPGKTDSWASVSNFHYRCWQAAATLPQALKVKARALAQDAGSTEQAITAIYKFVQQHYLGETPALIYGGFIPASVRTLLTQKQKDIRSLHLLLSGMLREAGIEAEPAVLLFHPDHEGLQPHIPKLFYREVLTYLPAQNMWLELFPGHKAAGDLRASVKGRNALLLRETGGDLRTSPALGPEDFPKGHLALVRLRDNGKVQIEGQLVYGKMTGRNLPWLEEKERLKNHLQKATGLPGTHIARIRIAEDPDNASKNIEYRLTLKDWARDSADCLLIPLRPLLPLTGLTAGDRNYGYDFVSTYNAFDYADTLFLLIPEGYRLSSPDKLPRKFAAPMASFEWDIQQGDKYAVLCRRLRKYPFRMEREALQAYRQFWQELRVLHTQSLLLVPEKS